MHFSSAVLVSLALVVPSALAASVPRSSIQGSSDAKVAFQKRQARTADVVRRLRDGPKRKRADPSAAVCPLSAVGQNILVNGNFETGSAPPWSFVYTNGGANDYSYYGVANGYGIGDSSTTYSTGAVFQTNVPGKTGHLEQANLQVCDGYQYDISFVHARRTDSTQQCEMEITLTGTGLATPISVYSGLTCSSTGRTNGPDCPNQTSQGQFFSNPITTTVGPFSAETAAGSLTLNYDVTCKTEGTSYRTVSTDNWVFARKA